MGGEGDYVDKTGRSCFYKYSHHPNCIYLYPREHFKAHELLYKEHPDIYGLYAAVLGTTKSGSINIDDYADLRAFNRTLPQRLQNIINDAGEFHYKIKKDLPRKTDKDTSNYVKEQERRRSLGIGGSKGEHNGMFGNGEKISGGNNGHASVRYFYKDKTFETRNELVDYLHSIGVNITRSAIRIMVHGEGTRRLYNMYKDVFDNLSWEFKDHEDS